MVVHDCPRELGHEGGGNGRVGLCAIRESKPARLAYNAANCEIVLRLGLSAGSKVCDGCVSA